MDRIIEVRWHPYRIPLKRPFITAHSIMAVREGAIVEVIMGSGIAGYGEIAPLAAFGGESLATMLNLLPILATHLRNRTIAEALHSVEAAQFPAPVICGLETALLDALGKSEGRGVSAMLAGDSAKPRPGVLVNAAVGANTSSAAAEEAKAAVASGFRCVKLKVGWEQDISREIERIAAVREAVGPGVHLRLDANEGWNREQAMRMLSACVRFDIQYVEQPLKASDLDGMRLLRQAALVPIAADESLAHMESAYRILDCEAADILIIKLQLIGGLRASARLIREAAKRGVGSVVTSSIETSIGLLSALHLAAAMSQISLECGLATLPLLEDDLLIDDLPIHDGFLALPGGSGLGARLDREALERYQAK